MRPLGTLLHIRVQGFVQGPFSFGIGFRGSALRVHPETNNRLFREPKGAAELSLLLAVANTALANDWDPDIGSGGSF